MMCVDCNEYEARWILERDDQYLLICEVCLLEARMFEGEINLDFWLIELGDWKTVFNDVNQKIKYWKEMYGRAYRGEFRSSTPTLSPDTEEVCRRD